MSMLKKIIEYSIEEIESAEHYVKLALCIEDPSVSQKFNELAKDEIRHYEYLKSVIKKEELEMEKTEPHEDVHKEIMDSYVEMIEEWKDKVVYKINNYQIKK